MSIFLRNLLNFLAIMHNLFLSGSQEFKLSATSAQALAKYNNPLDIVRQHQELPFEDYQGSGSYVDSDPYAEPNNNGSFKRKYYVNHQFIGCAESLWEAGSLIVRAYNDLSREDIENILSHRRRSQRLW